MLPFLSTAMVMFSGLVCVGILTALGRSTGTVLLITGMVMRKMISSTSMTSTSGVVLMFDITVVSSELPPTLIDMVSPRALRALSKRGATVRPGPRNSLAEGRGLGGRRTRTAATLAPHAGTAHQVGMQVAGKVTQGILQELVAAEQPVVTHDRRYRDEQTDGGHDERLAHRSRDLVDARLAGDADRHQRVQNAPHRTEQAYERGYGPDGREQTQAAVQLAVDLIDGALQRHGDPLVQVDAVGEATVVMRGGAQAVLGDRTEVIALLQPVDPVLDRGCGPELLLDHARGLLELALVPELGEHHVPGGQRHDQQQDQHGAGDDVAGLPQGSETIQVVGCDGGLVFHSFPRKNRSTGSGVWIIWSSGSGCGIRNSHRWACRPRCPARSDRPSPG